MAREKLAEKAEEILNLQLLIIKQAITAGDYETAAKANQFLIEHMPNQDGETMVDVSVDKPKQIEQKGGAPQINIGFALGGITPKALPQPAVEVIEVEPDDVEASTDTTSD